MRELLIAAGERRDAGAESAIALFCHRARKYLGANLAVLGGADAIVREARLCLGGEGAS